MKRALQAREQRQKKREKAVTGVREGVRGRVVGWWRWHGDRDLQARRERRQRGGEERIGKRRVVGLVKWRLVGGAGMSGRLPVRGREGCWGGSSEIEFTPSEVRQFVSDHGARKMLPVVYGTGGPPSSRWRRRATIFLGSASGSTSNIVNSSWIIKPTSTATVMTTALGLLMVLLPAAYPEKISIGEWVSNNRSNSVLSFVDRIREMAVKATKGERTRCKESFCDQRSNDYGGLLHSTPTCTFLFNDGWK